MSHIDSDTDTTRTQPQEPVEDRPNVGTVTPDDYPDKDDASRQAHTISPPGKPPR